MRGSSVPRSSRGARFERRRCGAQPAEARRLRLDVGVRQAARPDRLLDSLLPLSAAADRGGRGLLVQQPAGQVQLPLAQLHLEQLALLERRAGDPERDRPLARDRPDRQPRRDRARHDDCAGTRSLQLPRSATTNILIFLPLSTPEIVLGASLLTLFLHFPFFPFGFWTILIAHVMFCISFAVVTVKARLIGFDRHLEEAAMDLGANEWRTFQKVTLPLITPAILAAFLLCFAISIDDFVVTYFNAGSAVTFPIYVWGAARIGAPAQVNVIGTAIFVIAISAALANVIIQMRREKHA